MNNYRERLVIVTYDISNPRRWRKVFKCMKGFGEWLQYSVFQCRLTAIDQAELVAELDSLINHAEDHVLLLDVCAADKIEPKVTSLGKPYIPPVREVTVV
ncbi:CRISPR-associated endonuclease Cas2 [Chromatiales bacterium (ex Bugula neritina AB1)]|nr:CRISPR-associated endonuclease Cas2 [Chromatiales bacterium (ex Bugula neritina AB1)]